jgi:energy-coupling factor transport system permease protein
VHRTRYRPDPWRLQETIVAASGAVVALVLVVTAAADTGALNPVLSSMSVPSVPPAVVVGALLAALPAVLSTGVRPGRSR